MWFEAEIQNFLFRLDLSTLVGDDSWTWFLISKLQNESSKGCGSISACKHVRDRWYDPNLAALLVPVHLLKFWLFMLVFTLFVFAKPDLVNCPLFSLLHYSLACGLSTHWRETISKVRRNITELNHCFSCVFCECISRYLRISSQTCRWFSSGSNHICAHLNGWPMFSMDYFRVDERAPNVKKSSCNF